VQNATSRSRTPTPQIESTSQELGDSPSASSVPPVTTSPAVSDGQCMNNELSITTAAASTDGMFPVQNDVYMSEAGDLSGALSGWPDMKDSQNTESSENLTFSDSQTGWCIFYQSIQYIRGSWLEM